VRPIKPDIGHLVQLRSTSSAWDEEDGFDWSAFIIGKRGIEVLLLIRGNRKWIRRDRLEVVQ
jgi:hypothetical protein